MLQPSKFLLSLAFLAPVSLGQSGSAYCFGDGSGAACPCSSGNPGEGCANSSGAGATLTGSGNAHVLGDTFLLNVAGVPGAKPGLILRGNNQVAIPAGEGILCASGGSQRSHVQVTSAGATSFTDFNGNPFGASANSGGVPTNYQFWYRDPSNTCAGSGFNFSNAWSVTWTLAGPPADITVFVVMDGAAQGGASVTLQGTDATSQPGLTQQTMPNGETTFLGVSGPYTVTAQSDLSHAGVTTRLATSLIDISPALTGNPAVGVIGIPILPDFDGAPLVVDAFLSGRVLNMPALSGAETIGVVARSRTGEYEWWSGVNPTTGNYTMPIPSGVLIDCHVVHREGNLWPSSPVIASLIVPGVGQTGPGTTLSKDFDFASSNVIPWNIQVPFTALYVDPNYSNFGLQLVLEDVNSGIEFDFSFHDGLATVSSINLPNISDPSFAGYRVSLGADVETPFDEGQEHYQVLTATPIAIVFDFFLPPTILSPVDGVTLSMQQFYGLSVQVLETSTWGFGDNGVNIFELFSDGLGLPPAGIDETVWQVLTPPGMTSFDLPVYGQPMFAPTQLVGCEFVQWRELGYAFDYDTFFGPGVASNLNNLEANTVEGCESGVGGTQFYLVP
ncbi:MAG: hypothetical protein ACI9F9_000260 [Candidatus Paceibacteria bacterium]|jgi:hypothetical protein